MAVFSVWCPGSQSNLTHSVIVDVAYFTNCLHKFYYADYIFASLLRLLCIHIIIITPMNHVNWVFNSNAYLTYLWFRVNVQI